MYICTECNARYDELPEFCDCGNDSFKEVDDIDISDSDDYSDDFDDFNDDEPVVPKKTKPKKLSAEELAEIEEEKKDRQKALITVLIFALISLILVFLPPYPKSKAKVVEKAAETEKYSKLPAIETYWDNSLPSAFRYKDPYYNLPVLNKSFSTISPVLREYLVNIGTQFSKRWDSSNVQGEGECRVVFTINKEGVLELKKISVKSDNESLDDSVSLLISKVNNLEVPPDDYKGEKIVLAFKLKNNAAKVYFPTD